MRTYPETAAALNETQILDSFKWRNGYWLP